MKNNLNKILAAAAAGLFSSQAHAEEAPALPPQAAVGGITFEDQEAEMQRMGRGAHVESTPNIRVAKPSSGPSLSERFENIQTTIEVAPDHLPGVRLGAVEEIAGEDYVPGVEYGSRF